MTMSQPNPENNPNVGHQRKQLEDMIRQCDALINELYDTIELFTLGGVSSEDGAMHTDAAQELVYYTRKRVELVETLRALMSGLDSEK